MSTRYAPDGHADYPHEPGTLYDCAPCERQMQQEEQMSLNHGLARRIAAEWHAPNADGFSALSHTGAITEELFGTITGTLHYLKSEQGKKDHGDERDKLVEELNWLYRYVTTRGVGSYDGSRPWSRMWDDSKVPS